MKYKSDKKSKEFGRKLTLLHDKIASQIKENGTSETLLGILYGFSLTKIDNLLKHG
jgi:hypothetical protein